MKNYLQYLLIMMIFSLGNTSLNAQGLFKSLFLDFGITAGQNPAVMYYDSIEEVSYIAGVFQEVNGSPCNVIKYDGTNFTFLPMAPFIGNINSIVRYKDKVYFGNHGLVTWDGASWAVIDSNWRTGIATLQVYEEKLYVMGAFDSIAGQPIGMVAVWNDTIWSDLYRIDTLLNRSSSDAIGTLAFYKGKVYVGGNFYHAEHPDLEDLMMCDGEKWMNVGGFLIDDMTGISNLLVWKDELYVTGGFTEVTGSPGNAIAKWDGTNWHRLGEGVMQSHPAITDILVFNDELYMCGGFKYMDGVYLGTAFRGFAKWDGHQWCSMGMHANNLVTNLGTWKDELFLMGGFTSINNRIPMQYISKWIGGDYTEHCSTPITNIEKLKTDLDISVSPNPITGKFNIRFFNEKEETAYTIKITNILGQVVYSVRHSAQNGTNSIDQDLEELAAGTYFMNISGGNKIGTVQLVKK